MKFILAMGLFVITTLLVFLLAYAMDRMTASEMRGDRDEFKALDQGPEITREFEKRNPQ